MSQKDNKVAKKVETFLDEDVIVQLKEDAKQKGMSLSGLIRMVLLEYLQKK